MRSTTCAIIALIIFGGFPLRAQEPGGPPPVIDVHMHAPMQPGPSDPAMEPYFALAQEYDLPVFMHMLPGGTPVAYEGDWPPVRMPNHRGASPCSLITLRSTRRWGCCI